MPVLSDQIQEALGGAPSVPVTVDETEEAQEDVLDSSVTRFDAAVKEALKPTANFVSLRGILEKDGNGGLLSGTLAHELMTEEQFKVLQGYKNRLDEIYRPYGDARKSLRDTSEDGGPDWQEYKRGEGRKIKSAWKRYARTTVIKHLDEIGEQLTALHTHVDQNQAPYASR